MRHDQSSDEPKMDVQRWWIVALCVSLFLLALCWSIDRSLVYLISAVVAFSLFKILQLRKESEPEEFDSSQKTRYKRSPHASYQQYRPTAFSVFVEDVKQIFSKTSSGARTPQQSRVFVILVAGFIGFIFFMTLVGTFLGGEDSSDDFYYYRAKSYYDAQQYDSAAYFYRLAIEANPDNADLYYERGNAFLYGQKADSALIMYDQALDIDPAHQYAQYKRGYIYFDRKNYDQALLEGKSILAYAPDYIDAMLLMGDSFYNTSRLDSALVWYESAYSNGYRSAALCHLMAYIHDTKGELDVAVDLYKEAIAQDTTIVTIYERLGELVPGEEGNLYRTKAATMK